MKDGVIISRVRISKNRIGLEADGVRALSVDVRACLLNLFAFAICRHHCHYTIEIFQRFITVCNNIISRPSAIGLDRNNSGGCSIALLY